MQNGRCEWAGGWGAYYERGCSECSNESSGFLSGERRCHLYTLDDGVGGLKSVAGSL